ncbi:hypothetical protein [Gracilibacillus sp. YIM 98692]|uniref:hypothetical protein n=1 Tax=Gracilibacillus sp. YIM 98692 TaxID=2663532 RepID=UPI001F08A5DB|nr:hypothetical protein [Gracilibacillus sp. YIM 98692]
MKQFEKGKKLFMKGVDGDKKAVKLAYDIFLKLRDSEPNNALVEAYYGSTLALLGRDAVQPLEKADKAQEGLDALNQAISKNPNHKEIRMLRSNVCIRLPESFFQCSKIAVKDISFMLDRYQKDPSYLTNKQVKELIKDLKTAYQNMGNPDEASKVLQRYSKLTSKKK